MTFPDRIFLVGLPGSGKSTFGQFLAGELNYSFCDLDESIVAHEGQKIPQIFSEKGEDYFRKVESEVLRSIVGNRTVIATGGGTPCFLSNMDWMNAHGLTVFLNTPIEMIIARVKESSERPLIGSNPSLSIEQLLTERILYYKQAGMESGLSDPCEILAELQNSLSEK